MKLCHSIHFRVFCKEEEDIEKIKDGLKFLAPFNYAEEKIKFEVYDAQGFNEKRIQIFEITLEKDRHISKWLEYLKETLNEEQKRLLIKQLETRVDDECFFYIRFDKDKLFEKKLFITDSGNCYHIKIGIAAYPKKREIAKTIIQEILK